MTATEGEGDVGRDGSGIPHVVRAGGSGGNSQNSRVHNSAPYAKRIMIDLRLREDQNGTCSYG